MGSFRDGSEADRDPAGQAILLAGRRLASPAFAALFRQGMDLVDEAAAYLDGEGRAASRTLSRGALHAYAQQSMRLSTRLMQLASWLLLRRAVAEGEMNEATARREAQKIDLIGAPRDMDHESLLPEPLLDLILRSHELQRQIRQIDATLAAPAPDALRPNAVAGQLGQLRRAFEGR